MEANLPGEPLTAPSPPTAPPPPEPPIGPDPEPDFPPSNWGARVALLGVLMALGAGVVLGVPAIVIDDPGGGGELSTGASIAVQFGTVLGFLLVPLGIALRWGAGGVGEALRRLGVRRFRVGRALLWSFVAVWAYLVFAVVYVAVFGEPQQEDIAESFGPVAVQALLIVVLASVSEEVCFRGMLFGGLRERLPMVVAAFLSASVFGALHALTGISAVPPLIAFGFILALLYEKTGSVVPCIVLHMLNNSAALAAQ